MCSFGPHFIVGGDGRHALSEYQFPGDSFIGIYLIVGIMVPIRLGTVALLQLIVDMGLANTLTALILVYTAQGLPIAIFIFTGHTDRNGTESPNSIDQFHDANVIYIVWHKHDHGD